MLVNLTKAKDYRSQMGKHRRYLRTVGWYKRSEIKSCKLETFLVPTQYVGVYENRFGCSERDLLPWCKQRLAEQKFYGDRNVWDYGVADNVEQVIDYYNNGDFKGNHVIFFRTIYRDTADGWRWHKWGEYIGEKHPTTEYLADEKEIDKVVIFRIRKVF